MFQRFWLLLRWQKGRKEAWFRLLLVRIYEKIFAGLKSLNLTLNQLYLKKLLEETNDQHQKQRNIYHNLTLFKTIFNYSVYPRGCTDINVRIIYQVKRFLFFKVNLIKWYFSGPVNLEKKKKGWPVWKSQPPAWVLLGKPTLISIKNLATSLH